MPVMGVRDVRMGMPRWLVNVRMAVRAHRQCVVGMVMVPIVVPMRMFVLHWWVDVFVAVRLQQMQGHAQQHQCAAQRNHPGAAAVAERHRKARADEWREGEDGAGPGRAKRSLREQVETQAQAVATGADREQHEGRGRRRQGLIDYRASKAVAVAPMAALPSTT